VRARASAGASARAEEDDAARGARMSGGALIGAGYSGGSRSRPARPAPPCIGGVLDVDGTNT
jgi:hypothetical protein